ncbi:methyltransferase [Cupriavidus basilensis]|uniref:Methyltransferase n=1 Tax=Cupriavidus basilensis TaxID=68895 RepID=A0ABT6AYN2_9BURK|nr:methyltransferase [Cupriavidus basilensis]MDF3837594.1 methyltransferase [Cupriavidus basilensis]
MDIEAGLRAQLLSQINASWMTGAVHAACRLRIPEHLMPGPRSVTALAAASACHPSSLWRLLRALVSLNLCSEGDDGAFALTQAGALLLEDHPRSLRAWAMLCGSVHLTRWGELDECVRSGLSYHVRHAGEDNFIHLNGNAEGATLFNRAMIELTRSVAEDLLRAVDLGHARRVVDVGGGSGALLSAVLVAYPAATGVLFDLAHAIGSAGAEMARAGVARRCELVAGSFFDDAVPAGGDVYLLKSVLHNWDDVRCAHLLGNCHRAMPPGARLLVVERIVPDRLGQSERDRSICRSDLNMLSALSGRERREAEFQVLLAQAGLTVASVTATAGEFSVIDAIADELASEP